jgi:hypothetical protein
MPYLVLALGAVLSICGALSIYFGYGIVEVERGWTGVIAGATALTGGIIVMALGLVIKSLGDLRAALKPAARPDAAALGKLAPTPEPEPYEDKGSAPGEEPAPSATQEQQRQELERQDLQSQELQTNVLAIIMASQNNLEAMEPAPESAAYPHETGDLFEPQRRQTGESASGPEEQAPLFEQEAPEAPIPKPRQKVTLKPQAAAPRKDEPMPAAEPDAPSMDDWLDRAFSALDHEVASTPLRDLVTNERNWPQAGAKQEPARFAPDSFTPEPPAPDSSAPNSLAPEPPAPEPLAQDRPGLDHAAHERENEPIAPAQAGPEPVEIGRYEADGTAYIMYADGSIDAQSEAGVFRFSSMAELRAYIEGTE